MSNRFFITGTGTGVGKTVVSAIVTEALEAAYWKPVQAGVAEGTDSEWVASMISNQKSVVYPEAYKLQLPASPHISARQESVSIELQHIVASAPADDNLVIEGAGGLMVPLNDRQFVADLIRMLKAKVILVSKNELGSINHSLLTAAACAGQGIQVAGWIFTGSYMNYEEEIVRWSGIPKIASIPFAEKLDRSFVLSQAVAIRKQLIAHE